MVLQGAEGEELLRQEGRSAVVMQRGQGWEAEEKAPFLRNEPVKLTPAWEGSNLPNDTLNLKGIGMDLAPPRDKWNLIYLTLVLHGLGTLTAWNMFITAKDYFVEYKLKGSSYADNYLVYVGYAAQLPNFLFSWFNVFIVIGGDLATRIIWSLIFEVLIFVITIMLAMLDTSTWQAAFFWVTMVSVFIMNACNAVFQNSVYGVAGRLPPQYTGAVVLGTNICGTAVVLLSWATSASGNFRTSAIYYFIGGMFVLLICFDTYFALPLNRYYRFQDTLASKTNRDAASSSVPYGKILKHCWVQLYNVWVTYFVSISIFPARFYRFHDTLASRTNRNAAASSSVPYGKILKQCWVQLYNVWVVFFVSLSVFPSVHSDIYSMDNPARVHGQNIGFLGDNFVRITCFLTFNLFAMIGNITASFVQLPTRRWLAVFTTVRLVFIPLFLMCNYHPLAGVRLMPVVVQSDYAYWALAMLLGWSSGHGSSLAMMYVGGKVDPEHAAKAGMLGGAMLVTGIMSGIGFSGLGPLIVTANFWKTT